MFPVRDLKLGIPGCPEQPDRYIPGDPDALVRGGGGLILGKPVGLHHVQLEVFKGDAPVKVIVARTEGGFLQAGGRVIHFCGAGGEAQSVAEGFEIAECDLAVDLGPDHPVAGGRIPEVLTGWF